MGVIIKEIRMRSFVFAATLGAAIAIKTETRQEAAAMVIEAPEAVVLGGDPVLVLEKQEEPMFDTILDYVPEPIIPDEEQFMILDPVLPPVYGD